MISTKAKKFSAMFELCNTAEPRVATNTRTRNLNKSLLKRYFRPCSSRTKFCRVKNCHWNRNEPKQIMYQQHRSLVKNPKASDLHNNISSNRQHKEITSRKWIQILMMQSSCLNSEVHEWRHDSDKTQTNKVEWWMILKISLRAKGGVPKTLVKRKLCLRSLYFL